jgi:C1A family cysteine protease
MPLHQEINGKLRNMYGWRRDLPDHRDENYKVIFDRKVMPRMLDLSANCPRTEDQGGLGSCTANAATSAMEFLYKKVGKSQPELSRRFLYFATRVWIAHGLPGDDSGAQIRDVMKALAKYGVCLETTWPYDIDQFSVSPSQQAREDALTHQITKYSRLPNVSTIRACMAQGYPAVGGFSVPASMMDEETSKTGIVKLPGKNEEFIGGHCVFFVGYDDYKQLLKFQNSWGESWGDDGFGYLPYDYVTNWLASDFWSIQDEEFAAAA